VNVAVAVGLKLIFLALAVSGLATLWMAIVADTGASLLVTANGLRLLQFGRSAHQLPPRSTNPSIAA
jgi:Zn2+/Cd2+-exporting ATPase